MATTAKKDKAAGAATEGITVVSRPATFRRAGYTFSAEPTTISLADLSEEQLAQIEGDSNLVKFRVEIKAKPETKAEKA
jgi:hypothetical protein